MGPVAEKTKIRLTLWIDADLHAEISAIADADLRSWTAEIAVLAKEALTARKKEKISG